MTLPTADAWSRAGGGQNYSNGKRSNSSRSSSSSNSKSNSNGKKTIYSYEYKDNSNKKIDPDDIYLLNLIVAHPEIPVVILILGLVILLARGRGNPQNSPLWAEQMMSIMNSKDTSRLSDIKNRDPAFNEKQFLVRVKKENQAVQDAWSHGDMSPVRNYLSDGIFRRFESQLSIMKFQGIQNPITNLKIHSCKIHAADQDQRYDTIHVVIDASAKDAEVDASLDIDEAIAMSRKAPLNRYAEIWSYLRKSGVKTIADSNSTEKQPCPNCGASTLNTHTTRCQHCNVLINSGDYDWVLAEITQPIKWKPSNVKTITGLDTLVQRDPGFNRQAAEDRASYVFWRWIETIITNRRTPLSKCATDQLQNKTMAEIQNHPATHYKTAVGGVDLTACETENKDGRDRYHVMIMWSSTSAPNGSPVSKVAKLVLSRKSGALDPGGMSYARCPKCHGPLTENDSTKCEYCDAALSSGDKDWVLEQIVT